MRPWERVAAITILLICVGLALLYPPAFSLIFALSLAASLFSFIQLKGWNYLSSLPWPQRPKNPRTRQWLAATACFLSLLLLAQLAQNFAQAPIPSPPEPWWPFVWAGLLASFAWWLYPLKFQHPPAIKQANFEGIRWPLMVLGLACLALTAEMSGRHLNIKPLNEASHHIQVLLLGGGMGLIFWASRGPKGPPLIADRQEGALVLGITGLAFVLRLWHLDQDIRVFVDEHLFSEGVRRFWYEPNVPVLGLMNNANAPYSHLYSYGMAFNVEVLGRNFWGLRMMSILCGCLTVPALYLLGRQLFDRQTGAIAALFLACLPGHIHFSRIALNQVGDPLFGTLALAFWLRGLQTGQRRDYILGALAWGMTAYFYEGGRIVFFLLLLVWLGTSLFTWVPRQAWRPILLGLGVGLVVMAPFYYVLWAQEMSLVARFQNAGLEEERLDERWSTEAGREHYLKWHLQVAMGYYTFYPDPSLYYGGMEPLVLAFAMPFFLFGLAYCLYYWRGPTSLLLIWVGGNVLGNSLIRDSGLATRFANSFPAVALLMAIGLRAITAHIPPKRIRQGALAFGMAAIAILQINYYFNEHLAVFNQQHRAYRVDATDAILRSLDFPPHTQIYLMGEENTPYFQGMANFFRDDLHVIPYRYILDKNDVQHLRTDLAHAFFLLPDQTGPQSRILNDYLAYEGPFYTDTPYIPANRAYVLYYIPAQSDPLGLND